MVDRSRVLSVRNVLSVAGQCHHNLEKRHKNIFKVIRCHFNKLEMGLFWGEKGPHSVLTGSL